MELIWRKKKTRRFPTITGLLSFLLALFLLAMFNVAILTEAESIPVTFYSQISIIGFFLGIVGLFTKKHSRLFAIWGMSLHVFLLVFQFMMIGLSWMINPI
ncbi:hypothetical protein, partial [Bacillus sp. JJ722]|uniref:hypothetical protein n=1 Tax=Bacillus sp. JJ722 TaxID=3122973 RepID=UPI002FFEB4C1